MAQALSLSGGGYRGLFTAYALDALQARSIPLNGGEPEVPLANRFEIIAGTSIGGIIAIGLAIGKSTAEIVAAIKRHGPDIFKHEVTLFNGRVKFSPPRFGLLAHRYSADGLKNAIAEILGDKAGARLGEVSPGLVVTAVNQTTHMPAVFLSGPGNEYEDVRLLDAALATSAAPTYFPEHSIGTSNFIDGGIIANAPDLLALIELKRRTGQDFTNIRLLSIGTAAGVNEDRYRDPRGFGGLRLLMPTWLGGRNLMHTVLVAQEHMALKYAKNALNDAFIRIDKEPSGPQQKVIALDKTGDEASNTLKTLANDALGQHLASAELRSILRNPAVQRPICYTPR